MNFKKYIARVKFIASKFKKPIPDFYGVYEKFSDINDDNPWQKSSWIDGNIKKLESLPDEHFLTVSTHYVQDENHTLLPVLLFNNFCSTKNSVSVLDIGGGQDSRILQCIITLLVLIK